MSQGSIRTRGIKNVILLYNRIKHWQLAACKQNASLHSKISIFCFTMIWSRALIYSRPGGIPVMPWGDCIHCPPEKHNASQLQIQLKIPASTNTGCCLYHKSPLLKLSTLCSISKNFILYQIKLHKYPFYN